MMRPNINYYGLLGITSTATPEEITRAYRKKILEVHLDKCPGNEDTDLCYKTIEAYRILSNRKLRAKYDIQRDSTFKAEEKFVPAGYICYDVGQSQMSKRVLQNISDWKKEFDEIKQNCNGFSDNYFECLSTLMGQVIDTESPSDTIAQKTDFFCSLCDKKFLTATHHWEEVLSPYVNMLSCDKSGMGALYLYFETLLGTKYFNWKPRRLPSRLLGIWNPEEWAQLDYCDNVISKILGDIPEEDEFSSIQEQIAYIEETFLSDSETNEDIYPAAACKSLCWVIEHQNDQEIVVSRVNELLMRDEIMEIMYLAAIMKNFLYCGEDEWSDLISSALKSNDLELAMLWTKIGIEFEEIDDSCWYDLGMSIHDNDPVLAHFCFLSQGFDTYGDFENLGNEFTRRNKHFAAMEYHLKNGSIDELLEKSHKLVKKDPEASSIYRNVYYSLKIKSLLASLQKHKEKGYNKELETLIDFIQDLAGNNPVEGFKIISSTWPKAFEDPECYGMHRGTIEYLKQSRLTVKTFNLVLGAMHIIPPNEVDTEELTAECIQLAVRQMEMSIRSSDFDSLAEILLFLTNRSLPAAASVLVDLEQESTENNPGSHLKAMKCLIQGTMKKVERDWMGAMSEYQNALLCSPECMHRVLPCISKLTQDIEFHEAVVGEVQSECKQLKGMFDSEEYPEVEKYASNRNSLVITDVAPKIDFGYKNSMSKIQGDPDRVPNPLPEETPVDTPVETNTPLVTLDKNEEAINLGQTQGGPLAQLNAALSFIDLLKALPVHFQPGPIVMAASHFLRAMDETDDTGDLFAYRNAILQMAENLLKIDGKTQATIQHCLTHKHMLSILLSAHEKLSKSISAVSIADIESEDESSNSEDEDESSAEEEEKSSCEENESSEEEEENEKPEKEIGIDLINTSEANLISKFLRNVVSFPKIEPLANIPTLNCSDLVYVETLGNNFLSQFCSEKVIQKYQSPKISKHLHAYTHFVEVWKGRSSLADFASARLKAMQELLALRGWTHEDVEELMDLPLLNLTKDGWTTEYRTELFFSNPYKAYRSIHGFKINWETAEIHFLLTKDKHTSFSPGNLFDARDMLEIFSNDIDIKKGSFSLIPPDASFKSHPFKEAKFDPKDSQSWVPNYFQTLARAAMLLCYLSSGWEICSKAPFYMKPTDQGLLNRLEEHLQYLCRPVKIRKEEERLKKHSTPDMDVPNRFWLNMTEVFQEEEEEETYMVYKVGEVTAEVKVNTLVMTLNGTKTKFSPEGAFARDFTRNYDEIAECFPELLRLKELVKISLICTKLKDILEQTLTLMKQNGRSKEEISRIYRISQAIRELGISVDGDDEAKGSKNTKRESNGASDCVWLPATFCNNFDPDIYEVSAGVRMTPEVTYCPVSYPSDVIFVSLRELLR